MKFERIQLANPPNAKEDVFLNSLGVATGRAMMMARQRLKIENKLNEYQHWVCARTHRTLRAIYTPCKRAMTDVASEATIP